jgi:hypothetical protein
MVDQTTESSNPFEEWLRRLESFRLFLENRAFGPKMPFENR